ncbi:MAG TPA: hypothetical protein VKY54_13945 [Kiloniellales bacterium]|nr:hypothetical protein [Kiloniellales bacterium]
MKTHLRVLFCSSVMLLGSTALATAQQNAPSRDQGHHHHYHAGMDEPRSAMMYAQRDYDSQYGRSNQHGYTADPYHRQYPDYGSSRPYSHYDSWDQQRWQGHPGQGHGHHYQRHGHEGESWRGHAYPPEGWQGQRGPHPGAGHPHGFSHRYGDQRRQGHGYGADRQGWDRADRRDRRVRSAMRFHGMPIDTNDDGTISPDEAAAHAEMIFVLLDRNMDGVLTQQDRRQGSQEPKGDRSRKRVPVPRGEMEERQQSDEAGDGGAASSSQRADATERQAEAPQDERQASTSALMQLFAEMDSDGDSEVTLEEFMIYQENRYNELADEEGEVSPWRYRASWHHFSGSD